MRKWAVWALAIVVLLTTAPARADAPAAKSLFDPARHMRVSEVRPGMKGYGLSVFSGTKIDRFDVEVIDVVKNFNPKYDAILIRCKGAFLEHTGPIAGMSGSPIYLYDDTGRARMVGAFAYGWPLSKDPLGGVQPIEYMLSLPSAPGGDWGNQKSTASPRALDRAPALHWSLKDVPSLSWGRSNESASALARSEIRMQPLATPLMIGGMSAATLARIAPLFAGTGLTLMQAGGGAGSTSDGKIPPLEPGSVLAVPLLTGDLEMTALGTCTETIGDRIFGFGHPFFGEGRIDLPMGSGSVATVVANLETSFKLGFLSKPTGTLTTDQTVGVAGTIGAVPTMIPIEMRIVYDDGSVDQMYHFQAAAHPKWTAQIASAAAVAALTGEKSLPTYHTVSYDMTMDFSNGDSLHMVNTSVNDDGKAFATDLALPMMAAADNPFKQVQVTKLSGTIHISANAQEAEILSVLVPRSKYEPGETVKVYVSYKMFHGGDGIVPVELELPHDLPDGTYQLIVSDWTRYLQDEQAANAFKFDARNIRELFDVLRDVTSIRRNAIYMRLVRQADGVAVGHTAMPRLPSSRRQVMMDAGRSDITQFVTSTLKVAPTDMVIDGSAEFSLTIERHGKVEVAGAPPAAANPPAAGAAPAPSAAAPGAK
jgi:hypothetical protein